MNSKYNILATLITLTLTTELRYVRLALLTGVVKAKSPPRFLLCRKSIPLNPINRPVTNFPLAVQKCSRRLYAVHQVFTAAQLTVNDRRIQIHFGKAPPGKVMGRPSGGFLLIYHRL